jgi:predicted CXXCH cytochrome family protein
MMDNQIAEIPSRRVRPLKRKLIGIRAPFRSFAHGVEVTEINQMPSNKSLAATAAILLWTVTTATYGQLPSSHNQLLGVPGGIVGLHAPGFFDPLNEGCSLCHGEELSGAFAPSCFTCHGAFWDANQPQYPDSHTLLITGNRAHSDREAYCTFCHDMWGGEDNRLEYWHAPGHGTPLASGCGLCHGAELDGAGGIAFSCYWCHDRLWAGEGPPTSHTVWLGNFALHQPGYEAPVAEGCTQCHGPNLDDGFAPSCFSCHGPGGEGLPSDHTELKGGFAHKPGYEDPYTNCTRCHGPNLDDGYATSCFACHGSNGGPPTDHTELLGGFALHKPGFAEPVDSGCNTCHGMDLRGGLGPSCYQCHRREWDDHNFVGEPWMPEGTGGCQPCHELTAGVPWNHELPTSTFTVSTSTVAEIGQPNGAAAKCLGCHEGAPNGPAINDFGGNTGGTEFVFGSEAFGTDLRHHHPVSFLYDGALAEAQGGLVDPAMTPSGLTPAGTITGDMLEGGLVQCTSCHDPHDNSIGQFLVAPVMGAGGLCATCHQVARDDLSQHHIPGRDDPWGEVRGTDFNCTMCHGDNLEGNLDAPACTLCHNDFARPEAPPPGHHFGDRTLPYFDCFACHGDPVTGFLAGALGPSCYDCHGELWDRAGNTPPGGVSVAEAEDIGGVPTVFGASGGPLSLTAVVLTNHENDRLTYRWSFGDGTGLTSPSEDPTITHTYDSASGLVYQATLQVTDGIHRPIFYEFEVVLDGTTPGPRPDTWDVTTAEPSQFTITFQDFSGSLYGVTPEGGMAVGVETDSVIFWVEVLFDATGTTIWGFGNTYFGTVNRAAGTMSGLVIQPTGATFTFDARRR